MFISVSWSYCSFAWTALWGAAGLLPTVATPEVFSSLHRTSNDVTMMMRKQWVLDFKQRETETDFLTLTGLFAVSCLSLMGASYWLKLTSTQWIGQCNLQLLFSAGLFWNKIIKISLTYTIDVNRYNVYNPCRSKESSAYCIICFKNDKEYVIRCVSEQVKG